MVSIEAGEFVHVVATIDERARTGRILYVNPASSTIVGDSAADPTVELLIEGAEHAELFKEPAIVRHSSCEGEGIGTTGLVQADLPRIEGMRSIVLLVDGKAVSRFDAGASAAPVQDALMGLEMSAGPSPNRQTLTLTQAQDLQPTAGVTYSVQVKPDTGELWSTIAVGRPTPKVEIDRNQFAGARKAEVRVLRTNGFDESVIAHDMVDLS